MRMHRQKSRPKMISKEETLKLSRRGRGNEETETGEGSKMRRREFRKPLRVPLRIGHVDTGLEGRQEAEFEACHPCFTSYPAEALIAANGGERRFSD